MSRIPILTFCLFSQLTLFAVAQDEPQVLSNVDRDAAYVGQTLEYTVTVRHSAPSPQPEFSDIDGIVIQFDQQHSQQFSSTFQFNNQVRRQEYIQTQFDYTIVLNESGAYTIPSPVIEVDGQKYSGQERRITVLAVPKQNVVKLETTVTPQVVYPMQPFTVSLKVTVQELPGKDADVSPLIVGRRSMPLLSIPWLEEEAPEYMTSASPLNLLRRLVSQDDGFAINGYAERRIFQQIRLRFLPEFRTVKWQDNDGNETTAREYTFKRTFKGSRTGQFDLGQVTLNGEFAAGEPLARIPIYAVSNRTLVSITGAPTADRPPSWTGGIGSFQISSNISPRTASVGDPMTLEFVVRGAGTVDDLTAPNLSEMAEITEKFRIYEPTEESFEDGRRFTWSVRPLSEDVTELPSLEYSWFDPQAEKYVVESTAPVEIKVTAAASLSDTEIIGSENSEGGELEVNEDGLFPNHSSVDQLRANGPGRLAWISSWCTMITGYLLVSFGIRVHRNRNRDPAQIRRRKALGRAQESLNMITSTASSDRLSPDAVTRIISGLIADHTNRPEAGMTSHDAKQVLTELGVDSEVTGRAVELMERCDAVRYGASVEELPLAEDCQAVINELGAELKAKC